jgi:hypothetical protein
MSDTAQHDKPVWRSRSDFIIAARIDPGETTIEMEQLWVRKLDESNFELCCIPFFLYDVALGDTLEVDADLIFQRVAERSGRYVFRAYFGRSTYAADAVEKDLTELGALYEWSSDILLAIDARDADHAQRVADYLQDLQNRGDVMFETGKMLSTD